MSRPINLGLVGATGLVGETFLHLIEAHRFPVGDVKLFASEKSEGQTRRLNGRDLAVESLKTECFEGLDLVFFSSGDEISKEWAPIAVKAGAFAIDNSAAFRLDAKVSLVVPEVNGHAIPKRPAIIANPNCSTIQLVVALNALKSFGLKRVRVATYQAASGAGKLAQAELKTHLASDHKSSLTSREFPEVLAYNCIPQIGSFSEDGFCSEETKIRKETKKILELPNLSVSPFTVRVPAWNTHSEAVWVELEKTVERAGIVSAFQSQKGLVVSKESDAYPTARRANETEPVYVGRIHRDTEDPLTWMFWVVADNLWKGAALNGLQIAEQIFL